MTDKTQALPQKHDRVHFYWHVGDYQAGFQWVHYIGTVQDVFQAFGGSWMIDVETDDGCLFMLAERDVRPWRFSGN